MGRKKFFRIRKFQKAEIVRLHRLGHTIYWLAKQYNRSTSTISHIVKNSVVSRATLCTGHNVQRLRTVVDWLNAKYRNETEVTSDMILKQFRSRYRVILSTRSLTRLKQMAGVRARSPQAKIDLSDADFRAGYEFGLQYQHKSKQFWLNNITIYIDNKWFKICVNKKSKKRELKCCPRFVYRYPGMKRRKYVRKPHPKCKHNTGQKSIQVTVGVGKQGVLFVKLLPPKWNTQTAVEMYEDLARTVRAKLGLTANQRITILEDNDPSGYKTQGAQACKTRLKLDVFQIPPRRPDLSVMDYSIWKSIIERLNKENLTLSRRRDFSENRDQYIGRLKRAILDTPPATIRNSIGDMVRRCKKLVETNGDLADK